MPKTTWTVKEFQENYGISKQTAYTYTNISGFPVIKVGRKKLIIREAVEKWMLDHPDALSGGVRGQLV